jgi:hypothetical protein
MSTPNFVKDGNLSAPMNIQNSKRQLSTKVVMLVLFGNGGLMLCRIPVETAHERAAYYGTRTREQMVAVDQDLMKDQHPSMPISKSRQSRVTFGGRSGGSE